MEGTPLIPGGYAGPIKARRHTPPSAAAKPLWWAAAVLIPVLVFAIFAILNAGDPQLAGYHTKRVANAEYYSLFFVLVFLAFTVLSWRSGRLMPGLLGMLCLIAIVAGTAAGLRIFWAHFNVAHEFNSLVTYVNIDPARDVGGAFRDAGEVYFKEGSRVDTQRAIAVMSKDVYCAAPIVREEASGATAAAGAVHPPPSGTVDWWAVGKNCCDPSGEEFVCGLVGNAAGTTARAGLRQLYEYERHLYRLAADEWGSKFDIPVNHPLFFEWVVDPMAEVTGHIIKGRQETYYYLEMYAVANLVFATLATSVVVDLLDG